MRSRREIRTRSKPTDGTPRWTTIVRRCQTKRCDGRIRHGACRPMADKRSISLISATSRVDLGSRVRPPARRPACCPFGNNCRVISAIVICLASANNWPEPCCKQPFVWYRQTAAYLSSANNGQIPSCKGWPPELGFCSLPPNKIRLVWHRQTRRLFGSGEQSRCLAGRRYRRGQAFRSPDDQRSCRDGQRDGLGYRVASIASSRLHGVRKTAPPTGSGTSAATPVAGPSEGASPAAAGMRDVGTHVGTRRAAISRMAPKSAEKYRYSRLWSVRRLNHLVTGNPNRRSGLHTM